MWVLKKLVPVHIEYGEIINVIGESVIERNRNSRKRKKSHLRIFETNRVKTHVDVSRG